MRALLTSLGVAGLIGLGLTAVAPAAVADDSPSSFTIEDPKITESSGLAASRVHPGVYWTHNDSDDGPYIYAVDSRTGRVVATVTMRGIGDPRDVEAISIGPDGDVYVGDIGDNLNGTWPKVWIYRFPEPKQLRDVTVKATQFTVRYEDGPRDAEALMVHPVTGRVYIASKSQDKGRLYAGPERLSTSGENVFRRVMDLGDWGFDKGVTDGAFSPDGSRLVLRGYISVVEYRWKKDGKPTPLEQSPPMPFLRQGESVTFTPDGGTLMYGSEGERSPVKAKELDGELLPDATAKAREQGDDGKGGGGSESDDGGSGGGDDRSVLVGALAVGALALVFFGARGKGKGKGKRRAGD
ncbi:esterase-like activity of phytase family protein [Streptomyces sp. LX-29]|uniref:hypothetical protein n=1 Tax=Streptomyces sp. LX-29 TaxID=2900152 RepID=UPI00240D6684|nr:hypothetical protein [Streptomyces sp. LX-29]WFB08875.1 esterase-like activity of phytase family protein [Streptomyces sp. LX-29]